MKGEPYWNNELSMKQCVDAIMHLIFLGATKATQKCIVKWMQVTKRLKKVTWLGKIYFNQ